MNCGRSLATLILLCVFAADGIAGAPAERCRGDGRSGAEMRCPGKADGDQVRRRSRPRLPEESVIRPKGLEGRPAAPAVLPPAPAQPAPTLPSSPVPINACDPNGCRDAAGTRYNGWGPGMIRSDGKLCQQVGNMMHCN